VVGKTGQGGGVVVYRQIQLDPPGPKTQYAQADTWRRQPRALGGECEKSLEARSELMGKANVRRDWTTLRLRNLHSPAGLLQTTPISSPTSPENHKPQQTKQTKAAFPFRTLSPKPLNVNFAQKVSQRESHGGERGNVGRATRMVSRIARAGIERGNWPEMGCQIDGEEGFRLHLSASTRSTSRQPPPILEFTMPSVPLSHSLTQPSRVHILTTVPPNPSLPPSHQTPSVLHTPASLSFSPPSSQVTSPHPTPPRPTPPQGGP